MSPRSDDLDDFGRFSEPALMILISLAERPRHGYAMSDDIAELTGARPGPGTLYGAITRLESRGFITPIASEGNRRTYELTAVGRKALKARLAAMERVTQAGRDRLAFA
jgi:DNA-binding PadR family transcriptional regulator